MAMMRLWGWFKYSILTIILLAAVSFFFLLTSKQTIPFLADRYAPLYGLGYQKLSGTVLNGIEAESVTFENGVVADKLILTWDLFSLLNGKLKLHTLDVKGADANTLQTLVEKLSSSENNQTKTLPLTLEIETFHIEVDPFEQSGIKFKKIALEGEAFRYDKEYINIAKLLLAVESDVTTLQLEGNIHQKKVRITKLDILDIDTKAYPDVIKELIAINFPQEVVKHVEPEIEDYKAHMKHLLPRSIQIDKAHIIVKPENYPHIQIFLCWRLRF